MTTGRVTAGPRPRILITLQDPGRAADADAARLKNERYLEAVARAGGEPLPINESSGPDERAKGFELMDGLLLSGGADLDPALYGEPVREAVDVEPGRDALELEAWRTARGRRLPVLGICRGFQAINVFSGGRLVQHVDGHTSPSYPSGEARQHPLRLVSGSRLARILRPSDPGNAVLRVNSYHHQAVRRDGLGHGLTVAGTSPHPGGELVEAFESSDRDAFLLGVQCHPERSESTPPEFERLWTVFVDACRGGIRGERIG